MKELGGIFAQFGRDVFASIRNPDAAIERLRSEIAELEDHEAKAKVAWAKLKRQRNTRSA